MGKLRVSVIVPVHNEENHIKKCLNSLKNQTYPAGNYEVIVVDNGSEDSTPEIIQSFSAVKFVRETKKCSYSARNKGIKHSRGGILIFADGDCVPAKDWIEKMVEPFKTPSIKVVGGRVRSTRRDNGLQRYCDKFCHDQEKYYKGPIPFFATANVAFRKEVFNKFGLFNESLKSGGDVEICARVVKTRKEIYYQSSAVVYHHYPDSISNFMHRFYTYGKWHKIRAHKLHIYYSLQSSYYRECLKISPLFVFYRFLQDTAYTAGYTVGDFFGNNNGSGD